MPVAPEGEHELQALALRFAKAEGFVLGMLAEAATGHRTWATKQALDALAELRLLDLKQPISTAYLAAHPEGRKGAVADLAGSLALRLDRGARTAADGVRKTFKEVTADTAAAAVMDPLTAAVDQRGHRWALGSWAQMNCSTIGRVATSRGLSHRLGKGATVVINTGSCEWCRSHGGEAVIGEHPLPPFHPSCSCTATAA